MFTITPGEKVLILRKRRGMTQAELAHSAGTSRLTVNAVENLRTEISASLLERLAAALDTSVMELASDR